MAGCRPLTDLEVTKVMAALKSPRDQLLFILGIKTGFRISELLSLTIGDVLGDRIKVHRRNTKGKSKSRELPLHPIAREAISLHLSRELLANPTQPLFHSGNCNSKPLSRFRAAEILKEAFALAGLQGTLATHSLRKTFAKKVYTNLKHDLVATRDALGHSNVSTTVHYLATNQEEIDEAILAG